MSRSSTNAPKWILLTVSALVMLIALLQIIDNTSINRDWPETVTAVWLVWTFSYFFCSWSALRTPYLLASSYLTALCMFHLGLPIPAAFGLVNLPALTQGTKGFWFQQSAWCTLVALGAFGAGFALSLNCTSKLEIPLAVAQTKRATTLDTVRWAGVGLFVASITFLVMLIAEIGNPLAYSRMDLFRHSGDLRGLALFMMTFPTAAVLLVIGAQTAWQSWRAAIVAVIALGILLLSGYRSAALFPLMVGVILWAKTGRNIPWSVAAVLVGVVVVAIPAVAILRASGTYETLSTEKISESLQKAEATDTFIELGGTAGILAATMQLVPASEPYRYGETYLGALREAIPNISFEPRRSDRDQLLKRGATREGLLQLAPSDWLTFRLEPIKFRNGEGVGFSAIAEPYLNFGFSGVVLFFSGMGFALGRLDQENLIIRPGWLLFCGSVFWPLVRTVRNDVNNFTKPLVFLYLILGAWFLATSLLRYKARPGQAPYVG